MPIDQQEIEAYSNLEVIAKQVVEGFITGLHKSPFHGFSVEFAEHRLYNTGESTRYIDWKLYGRTDKLFVKRFEEETNLRCQILIDNSIASCEKAKDAFDEMLFTVIESYPILSVLGQIHVAGVPPDGLLLLGHLPHIGMSYRKEYKPTRIGL